MKVISEFIVRVFDLVEAEGRSLRSAVRSEARHAWMTAADSVMALAFLLVSVPFFVAGIGLMAAGLRWWLEPMVGRPLAAAITGVVLTGVGAIALFRAKVVMKGRRT